MVKKIVVCSIAALVLVMGQLQMAGAEDAKTGTTDSAKQDKIVSQLRDTLGADFQEFELTVDESGKLSYKGLKRSDLGEETSEKSFQVGSIDPKSVKADLKGYMSFSCNKNHACITYSRVENYQGRKGYNRKIKLRNDSFSISKDKSSSLNNTKQSFLKLIDLHSKKN